jgi:hypothetical protein
MSQLTGGILGAVAVSLALGAVQFASGRDLTTVGQTPLSAHPTATPDIGINRAAKADRAARVAGPAIETRTISLRLDGLSETSVLLRLPVAQEARNGSAARPVPKSFDRKLRVACEPVVSVLTEVAKQLQPGRCIT